MKGILVQQAGDPAQLVYTTLPRPTLAAGEVLVQVRALSINPVDVKARASEDVLTWLFGPKRPVILGWDIAGDIVEVAPDVQALQVGEAVFGLVNFFGNGRAYAEYVAVPATQLARKPSASTYEEAAATTLAALTAWQALVTTGNVQPGQRVLIQAGAGGVGHFAVQLAKHLGAYVIATSSARNRDFILSLGADEHIDYHAGPLAAQVVAVDLVLDTVGGEVLTQAVALLKAGGKLVTLPSPVLPAEALAQAATQQAEMVFMMVQSSGPDLQALADLLARGLLKPHVSACYPFEAMAEAHMAVETGRTVGKVVVTLA